LCANRRDARVEPKVLDFGIAKVALEGVASQTRTGTVIGTPAYMSPEQCKGGKAVDGRSDVYSLGCILYEGLCGRPPFVREGVGEMIVAHVAEPPDAPRTLVPDLPAELAGLVMRTLTKSPDDRLPSMDILASEIGRCLEAMGVRASLGEILPRRPVICPAEEGTKGPISLRPSFPGRTPVPSSPGVALPTSPTAPTPIGGIGGTRMLVDSPPAQPPPANPTTTFGSTVGESTLRPATSRRWAVP